MYCPVSRAAVYKRIKEGRLSIFLFHVTHRTTTLFGKTYAAPFGIPPFGSAALCAYRGDVVLARKETPASYHLAAVLDDCLERLVDPFNVDVGTNTALPGIDLTGYEVTDHVPHFRP